MKKLSLIILSFAASICMLFAFAACGETPNPEQEVPPNPEQEVPPIELEDGKFTEGLSYTEIHSEDWKTVIGYSVGVGEAYNSTEIVIPSTHNGLPVLSVGNTELIEMNLQSCEDEIPLSERISVYRKYAFGYCNNLKSVTIEEGVTSIGWGAFIHCQNLTDINIPDSVIDIDYVAFFDTGYYNDEANWENHVLYVGNYLIEAQSSISGNIRIKDGTLSIASNAFRNCNEMQSIEFPDSLIQIGEEAFKYCFKLTSIKIPNSVETIGDAAFFGCRGLTSLKLSDHLSKIGECGFGSCEKLTHIEIPDSVTEIGEYAFSHCSGVTSIVIPDSVIKIGEGAFYFCTSLTEVYYNGTKAQWEAIEKGKQWDFYFDIGADLPIIYLRLSYTVRCSDGDIVVKGDE